MQRLIILALLVLTATLTAFSQTPAVNPAACPIDQASAQLFNYSGNDTETPSALAVVATLQAPSTGLTSVLARGCAVAVSCSVACTFTLERDGTPATQASITPNSTNKQAQAPIMQVFKATQGVGAGVTWVSGGASCTNGTQAVTFTNGGGTGATGTITVSAGVPTGAVTITNTGFGYTSVPTAGQVATCTGASVFSSGALAASQNNVGTGTVLAGYQIAAGQTIVLDLTKKSFQTGGENVTVRTNSISGTVNVNFAWFETPRGSINDPHP